jgi:hypothetical protein
LTDEEKNNEYQVMIKTNMARLSKIIPGNNAVLITFLVG